MIVECNRDITRVWAKIIPNKKASMIIPIICDHVVDGNTIRTDEHCSNPSLQNIGFNHLVVCHKYNFVNLIQP